jgi:hypothetical protein
MFPHKKFPSTRHMITSQSPRNPVRDQSRSLPVTVSGSPNTYLSHGIAIDFTTGTTA